MNKTFFAMLLLISVSWTTVFSQQNPARATTQTTAAPQKQDETVRVGTTAVQTDVIVTDKSGRRITGLKAEDFQVLDEGAPQALDFFTAIEGSQVRAAENATAAAGAAQPSLLATPYKGRHIALVFDDLTMSVDNFLRARRSLADYINANLGPNDMAAVISTGGSLGSLQQFTNDKQRLLSALNRIAVQGNAADRFRDPRFHMTVAEALRIDSGDTRVLNVVLSRVVSEDPGFRTEDPTLTTAGGTSGGGMARSNVEGAGANNSIAGAVREQVRVAAKSLVTQAGAILRANLKTLENLFRGMADLPGRKVAVLMTETLSTLGGSSEDISNDILRLIDIARRSGVSVYALDAGGLRTGNVTAVERVTGAELRGRDKDPNTSLGDYQNLGAARALAAGTGGDLIANTNDLAGGIERAVEDSSTYYVLGFKPATLDNKFHRMSVSVKGKPELVVRSRRGYLAVNQETVAGTGTELMAAMISPVPRLDLPLEVVANVVPKDGEQLVITGLHLGRNYLTLPSPSAADQTTAYEVLAYIFAAGRDNPVGAVQRTVTFDLAKDVSARQKLKTEGFVLVNQFTQLPPGNYQMRVVVREKATGMVGSAYQFFEIPDVKNTKVTALSSLLLTSSGQTGFSGYNSFKKGGEMEIRYIIYNLPKDAKGITQRLRLTDDQGRVLMDSELPLNIPPGAGQSQAPQGTRLNLPTIRGHYALFATLRDAQGKLDIERRADLVIE